MRRCTGLRHPSCQSRTAHIHSFRVWADLRRVKNPYDLDASSNSVALHTLRAQKSPPSHHPHHTEQKTAEIRKCYLRNRRLKTLTAGPGRPRIPET